MKSIPQATAIRSRAPLRFGRIELEVVERRLLIDGRPARLGARAFDLLVVLAERSGELVGKNELLELVWPGLVVEVGNIAVQVNALRKVLGGDLIGTVPGRGYRLTARVESKTPADPATPAHAPDLQTRLPRVLPILLGRMHDLAALGALVDGRALVSVVGAGGIGKTLLVQHLLDARRRAHPHGVCWVELAGVTEAAALPATIAAALGVRLGGGDAFDALALAVGPLGLLLALDNAEHLSDAVGRLAVRLIDAAPGLKLVVTSQARLGVPTERVMRLPTLDLPPPDADVEQALATGAVALFVDRAQAADTRFALTEGNVAAVAAVCRSLDGLPLAIELAAARVTMLGIHSLANSMRDRLHLLTRNRNRSAPARQRTLRATLEWSHSFLDATEQAVFRRLAVVVGSCSLKLAQQIAADAAGDGPIDDWAVLDALDVLVDRSLVAVLPGNDDASPRYRLLESMRAFAWEQLAGAGEVEATQLRLAQSVSRLFAEAWEGYFCSAARIDDLRRSVAPDCDNARAALAWADCPPSLRLCIAAHLLRVLPYSLFAERLEIAEACEALLDAEPSLHLRVFGWLTVAIALLNWHRQRGRVAAEWAVELAREQGRLTSDRRYLCHALSLLAHAMTLGHEVEPASRVLAEMQAIEDTDGIIPGRLWRADAEMRIALLRGDTAEYLRMTREKLARTTDPEGALIGMANLIGAELAVGDAHAAAATGRALVTELASSRNELQLSMARINLCAALLALGADEEARAVAQAGWSQARRFGMQSSWANSLALLAALEKRPAAAARLCGYATAAHARVDERREINEATAFDRASRLVATALGDAEFERLQSEGRTLRDEEVAAIAFGTADT